MGRKGREGSGGERGVLGKMEGKEVWGEENEGSCEGRDHTNQSINNF